MKRRAPPEALDCAMASRRRIVMADDARNGIDFVEVSDDQRTLHVYFLGPVPSEIRRSNVRIEGGERVRDITVTDVEIEGTPDSDADAWLRVSVDRIGDHSQYRLHLVADNCDDAPHPALDRRLASIAFSFKASCPSELDCIGDDSCASGALAQAAEVDYTAKDYASFRRLILDRLALRMPEWRDRQVPDIGITLVELLAYAGDALSYYQDAVGTEAYLDTARQRISVRRHARLVDYVMHEGCNARAFVFVEAAADSEPLQAHAFYFTTDVHGLDGFNGRTLREGALVHVPVDAYEVFEPMECALPERFRRAHNRMRIHTWGDEACCLQRGATSATLVDAPDDEGVEIDRRRGGWLHLRVGDIVMFEEVRGVTTGSDLDADPTRRHAVRLTHVSRGYDRLLDVPVLEVEWGKEDALPFPLCVSLCLPPPLCEGRGNVTVARGNIVLADHGRKVEEPLPDVPGTQAPGECACDGAVLEVTEAPVRYEPHLSRSPLCFADPISDCPARSATSMMRGSPRRALPCLSLEATDRDGESASWSPRGDLLSSAPDRREFVAEVDDDGRAHLRFGDGELGRGPGSGTRFYARYRVGAGPRGNVGCEGVAWIVQREGHGALGGQELRPRNPLPATGGTAPESTADAKRIAPFAFRARRERAVAAVDYAELAQDDGHEVQRASAELRWTGSWYEAHVTVDPFHVPPPGDDLARSITQRLERVRRLGHDVHVEEAHAIPIDLEVEVCVIQHHRAAAVRQALRARLGTGRLVDGTLGFFHPDALRLGEGIHISRLLAAIVAVEGVATARVKRLSRLHGPESDALDTGVLALAANEVACLDADANAPERGRLVLKLEGGR